MTKQDSDDEIGRSLTSITRGASLYSVGQFAAMPLKFGLTILMTRALGPALYGTYAYSLTILFFTQPFVKLGAGKSLQRFVPANEDNFQRRDRFAGLAYLSVLTASILASASIYLMAPMISAVTLKTPILVSVLRILALALPFQTLIWITGNLFKALEQMEYHVLFRDFARPVVNLTAVVAALALGYSLLGVVAAIALGTVLVSLLALTLLYERSEVHPAVITNHRREEVGEYFHFSVPLLLGDLGSVLYNRIDILIVGFLLTDTAVGTYRVAILVATLVSLPLSGIFGLFPSVASRLYSNGSLSELETVYETVTRWSLTFAIPIALVTAIYSGELLLIFGKEFTAGALVLTLFTVTHFVKSAGGPSGLVLMMTGNQYLTFVNQVIAGAANLALNVVLINKFGLVGAAVATTTVFVLLTAARVAEVWFTEGMLPYSQAFWKPLLAGSIAAVVMVGLSQLVGGYGLLIGGSLLGGSTYLAVLVWLGLEDRDREFIETHLGYRLSRNLQEWW